MTVSKLLTLFWGVIAICFALFAHLVENLIEAVNILGSIFYGTILGIFLLAFFFKWVKGRATFIAALIVQTAIIFVYLYFGKEIAYLWYNFIGCMGLIILANLLSLIIPEKQPDKTL